MDSIMGEVLFLHVYSHQDQKDQSEKRKKAIEKEKEEQDIINEEKEKHRLAKLAMI